MACSSYLLVKFGLFSYEEVLRCGHDELSVKTWKKEKKKHTHTERKSEANTSLTFSRHLTHFE